MDNYFVYMHENKINSKRYIGITKLNPDDRWRKGKGYKKQYFYRAVLKYGWNNFNHIIVFENLNYEDACNIEMNLISKYNTTDKEYGYNIELGGNANKNVSDETRKKLKLAITGMFSGEKHYNYGRHLSNFTKNKISKAHINMKQSEKTKEKISKWYRDNSKGELNHFYGKHHSVESKQKISLANKLNKMGENNPMFGKHGKDNPKSISVTCLNTNEVFESITEAGEMYNINPSNISMCCNGKRKSAGKDNYGNKLIWKFT